MQHHSHKRQAPKMVFPKADHIFISPQREKQTLQLEHNSFLDYQVWHESFMTDWYHSLFREMDFKEDRVVMGPELHKTPRTVSWVAAQRYTNYTYAKRTLTPKPLEDHPTLSTIFHWVQSSYGYQFNGVLCNLYEHGGRHISFHADDEDALGDNPTIVSISLQNPLCRCRKFLLEHLPEHRPQGNWPQYVVPLVHGTVLVMRGATQHYFQHAVPPAEGCNHPRINLNFRLIKKHVRVVKEPRLPLHKSIQKRHAVEAEERYGSRNFKQGQTFKNQLNAYNQRIHRHPVRGIVGNIFDGAESIVLANNKRYPNIFSKTRILYLGAGYKTVQTYRHGNGALVQSCFIKNPVRVLRKLKRTELEYCGLYFVIGYIYLHNKFHFELHKNKNANPKWIQKGSLTVSL